MPRVTKAQRAHDEAYWEGFEAGIRTAMQGIYRTEDAWGNPHELRIVVIPHTWKRPLCAVLHNDLKFFPLLPRDAAKLYCEILRNPGGDG